jgi:hypothetical protein
MPNARTIGALVRSGIVTDAQVDAAALAYLAGPTAGSCKMAPGIFLDVAAAVEENQWARIFVTVPGFSFEQRRTAILLARPG